jgi:hypothetical protein
MLCKLKNYEGYIFIVSLSQKNKKVSIKKDKR